MTKTKIALVTLGAMLLPVLAFAQPAVSIDSLTSIVASIERALWIIFGAIAVICFVMAGILFLTAGGAPEKVQAARSAFIWGVAGVVVGIVAYSIIAIVSSVIS